ncbi:hypothetical protein Tco_0664180, partial [Tanacetum coccineum]
MGFPSSGLIKKQGDHSQKLWHLRSSCYIKSYGGVQLSGTPATHYYLNPDIQEVYQTLNVYKELLDPTPTLEVRTQRQRDRDQNNRSIGKLEEIIDMCNTRVLINDPIKLFRVFSSYIRSSTTQSHMVGEVRASQPSGQTTLSHLHFDYPLKATLEVEGSTSDCLKHKSRTDTDSDVFSKYSQLCARNSQLCAKSTTPRSPATSLDIVHTSIVRNAQTIYNESPNSVFLLNEDSSRAGASRLNHSKRTRKITHQRLPAGDETAFSAGAHANSVDSTSSTTEGPSHLCISASNPPGNAGNGKSINLYTAINQALQFALDSDPRSCVKENVALTHFDEEFVQEDPKEFVQEDPKELSYAQEKVKEDVGLGS